MSRNPADRRTLYAAFFAVYLFWGSSYLAARIGVQHLPPFLFVGVRFTIAGAVMLALSRVSSQRVLPLREEWRHLAILALVGFVFANGANIWALQFVTSNQAALLNTSAPLWIVLLGAFGRHAHRPDRRGILGLLLGVAGTCLVIRPGTGSAADNLGPQLMILIGCLGWACSTIYLRNMGTRLPVLTLIGWQMFLGGLGLGALGLVTGEAPHWHWSWQGAVSITYLIVFASCCAHTAYAWLTQHTTPASLGTYAYINPLIAVALGWLVLGEQLSGRQLTGMVVALAGVLLINWPGTQSDSRARNSS